MHFCYKANGVVDGVGRLRVIDVADDALVQIDAKGTNAPELAIFIGGKSRRIFSDTNFSSEWLWSMTARGTIVLRAGFRLEVQFAD